MIEVNSHPKYDEDKIDLERIVSEIEKNESLIWETTKTERMEKILHNIIAYFL